MPLNLKNQFEITEVSLIIRPKSNKALNKAKSPKRIVTGNSHLNHPPTVIPSNPQLTRICPQTKKPSTENQHRIS